MGRDVNLEKAINRYENRKAKYNILIKRQNKALNRLSSLRFVVFAAGLIGSIKLYTMNFYLFTAAVLCTVVLFSYLIYLYRKISKNIKYTAKLIEINEKAIKRLNGEWKDFNDSGEDFIDENHRYSYDLDLFGKGSLFQWINEANTYCGREQLQKLLTEKPEDEGIVYKRQAAIAELARKTSFRQRLSVEGIIAGNKNYEVKELLLWLKEKNGNASEQKLVLTIRILSFVTMLSFLVLGVKFIRYVLYLYFNINAGIPTLISSIPSYIPLILIMLQYIMLRYKREDRLKNIAVAEKYCEDIKIYENILQLIEKNKFKAEYNAELYKKLYNDKSSSASKRIERFSKICDSIQQRRNMLYPLINAVFMLEYRWDIKLSKWKSEEGEDFETWLGVIGKFEALSSLAVISFDNHQWIMPKLKNGASGLTAKNMGHPLLGEKMVCNDVQIQEPRSVMLVTGSNMSGKSTLMRTVGINLVLAYAGAAVCADKFECTIMDLYSCMRIKDNLDKNISSFYAEILKIKRIVEASNKGEKVFFLLDEIFRGTNSRDRHTGAAILIRQLSKTGNLGLVSTHDLELGQMEEERNSKVKNYHFEEYYKDDKIYFDYKLKSGISTTRNAVFLMKLAGIEIKSEMR